MSFPSVSNGANICGLSKWCKKISQSGGRLMDKKKSAIAFVGWLGKYRSFSTLKIWSTICLLKCRINLLHYMACWFSVLEHNLEHVVRPLMP